MQKQSSYIFLKNNSKEKPESSKHISDFICNTFKTINRIDDENDIFIKRFEYECDSCNITFIIHSVADSEYLDINIQGKTTSKIINCLEQVQNELLNSGIRDNYIYIISYDAISEYYCNKMVVKLNEFERNLRKLFFNIYILNLGKEYYQATMPSDLQNKIKGLIGSTSKEHINSLREKYAVNKKQAEEIARLQLFFYSFELGDINYFLFTPRFTEYDKKTIEKFLSQHSDLSKLTDEKLRNAFSKFLPKSDWDRFFSDKIKIDNIDNLFKEIREYRNSVAHFKFFDKNDYNECNKKVTKLNKAIIKAIRITEEKDFAERNNSIMILEAINKLSEQTSEPPESIISIIIALAQMRNNVGIDSQMPQKFANALMQIQPIPISNIQSEDDNIDFSDHAIDDEAAADGNI